MFFHTIKRAGISSKFLLMGLDELAESLDSVNILENKYLGKIDSLENELERIKTKSVLPKKVKQEPKKDKNSDLPFFIIITTLAITSILFALKLRRKK